MTDADVYELEKNGPVRPSCRECGCPATAVVVGDGADGYRCGHCHDAAPLYRPESVDNEWPDWLQECETA